MPSDTVRYPSDNLAGTSWIAAERPKITTTEFFDGRTRSSAEAAVLRELRRLRKELRQCDDDIGFACNVPIELGHTWVVPDFLVWHKKRLFVIEVDGPSHKGRYLQDKSRDQALEDTGITFVRRIDVADTNDPDEVQHFLRKCLGHLRGH